MWKRSELDWNLIQPSRSSLSHFKREKKCNERKKCNLSLNWNSSSKLQKRKKTNEEMVTVLAFFHSISVYSCLLKRWQEKKKIKTTFGRFFPKKESNDKIRNRQAENISQKYFKSWSTKNRKRESTLVLKHGKTQNRKNMGKKKIWCIEVELNSMNVRGRGRVR